MVDFVQKIQFLCHENSHRNLGIISSLCCCKVKYTRSCTLFLEKEYQSRGAPHYHILLWIKDAPVIGVHPEHKITEWIKSKITSYIPDEKISPELHGPVTHLQLHKCNSYCRRKKYGNGYVTYCKFGFPREVVDEIVLNKVEVRRISRKKVYYLQRTIGKRELMITTLSFCICRNQTLMCSMLLMQA